MDNATKTINPISMTQLADMTGHYFDQLMDVFTNQIPKELSKNYGESFEADLESFMKEFSEMMLKELDVTLNSIIQIKLGEPTKFLWELTKCMSEASAKVKRRIAERFMKYDVEADIERTTKELDQVLASEFKTEVVLWKLMDENRWSEALLVAKAIELERENADLPEKIEVANWKQRIAQNLGDADTFFESLSNAIKIAGDQISYSPDDMTYAVTMLLSKFIKGFAISMTNLGRQKLAYEEIRGRGSHFMAEQVQAFQGFIVKKIIDATFKNRIIHTGDDFRKFITDTKRDSVVMFKRLNPYVAEIIY